ncbi:hypothetical protein AG0111_0g4862 [Alternaria gaisen]|uniref:Uncharacterized protein n=1 Tax=Alternaria gaisen TaxID=167740 RepID=A0ACB6FQG1_9PLEO|nr:hypothetical protein AG0111_0g4862 [Alternaria gaisen]
MASHRTQQKFDAQSVKGIEERFPQIVGWMVEFLTFQKLHNILTTNRGKDKINIGLIRGPDHVNVDGGFIIDPPLDFPYDDLTSALRWAEKRAEHPGLESLQIYRFDAKMGTGSPKPGQWAPFFMVTVPQFPSYLCIVPIRCWVNLHNVNRRRIRAGLNHLGSSLRTNQEIVFGDLLAPFAVHESELYNALTRIVHASRNKTTYINPTNEVEFHGWCIPKPDTTTHNLLEVRERSQHTSRVAINRLLEFVEKASNMSIAFNPVGPLVCDMFLIDHLENKCYNVEHKHLVRKRRGDMEFDPEWNNAKLNWHFLFHQCGDELTIYTRLDENNYDSNVANSHTINMAAPGSDLQFINTIRANGSVAKSRLREKWRDAANYDATIATNSMYGEDAGGSDDSIASYHAHQMEVAQTGLLFRDKINEQCCKLRYHACILLHNHPCANAVIVEHVWLPDEEEMYRTSGILPVSLVINTGTKRCIAVRFLPHRAPAESILADEMSMSRLFEPAMNTSWDVPACTTQDFVYVATTGHIPVLGQISSACLDTAILLPSTETTILPDSRACEKCDGRHLPREWTYVQPRVLGSDVQRSQQWSLLDYPFLKDSAEPLNKVYNFDDGSVHQYFCETFTQNDRRLITTLRGPKGLLQRQWNHGDLRLAHDLSLHPTYQ